MRVQEYIVLTIDSLENKFYPLRDLRNFYQIKNLLNKELILSNLLINKCARNEVNALPVKKTNKYNVPRIKFVDLNN